jgi:hypothetical protein
MDKRGMEKLLIGLWKDSAHGILSNIVEVKPLEERHDEWACYMFLVRDKFDYFNSNVEKQFRSLLPLRLHVGQMKCWVPYDGIGDCRGAIWWWDITVKLSRVQTFEVILI